MQKEMAEELTRSQSQVAEEMVGNANSKQERAKKFREEVVKDLKTIEGHVNRLKSKLKSQCWTKENLDGLLSLEATKYTTCFKIDQKTLMDRIDKDLKLWQKNHISTEKMKSIKAQELLEFMRQTE